MSRDNVKAQKYLNMILYVIADGIKKKSLELVKTLPLKNIV